MGSKKNYDAFISYSHKDKAYASVIQKSIETLGLPFYKRWLSNVSIFRDERKIPLSGSLSGEIQNGIKNSRYLIVIASKNSGDSEWVKEEILNWYNQNKDGNGYITNFNFILISDDINWDKEKQAFDNVLTTALPDFDNSLFKELPLWADIRQYCSANKIQTSNANYQWEIAKIKALLLGKKPDEIIDDVSKARRLFRGIMFIVIASLLLLTGFAYNQKVLADNNAADARIQRDSAILQKQIADSNAKRAVNVGEKRLALATLFINPEGTKFNTIINFPPNDFSFGLVPWDLKIGTLGTLLKKFYEQQPTIFVEIFGDGDSAEANKLIEYTNRKRNNISAEPTDSLKNTSLPSDSLSKPNEPIEEINLSKEPWKSRR